MSAAVVLARERLAAVAAASECTRSSPNDARNTRFTLTSRWNRPFASPSLRVGQCGGLTWLAHYSILAVAKRSLGS